MIGTVIIGVLWAAVAIVLFRKTDKIEKRIAELEKPRPTPDPPAQEEQELRNAGERAVELHERRHHTRKN